MENAGENERTNVMSAPSCSFAVSGSIDGWYKIWYASLPLGMLDGMVYTLAPPAGPSFTISATLKSLFVL